MIRATRNFIQKTGLGYVAILLLLVTSCSKDAAVAKMLQAQDASGEELFRAIFFAQGEIAQQIPSYKANIQAIANLSEESKTKFYNEVDILVTAIGKENPSYFDEFKQNILTKDHQVISDAILDGSEKIFKNLHNIYPNIDSLYNQVKSDYASGAILTDGKIDNQKVEAKAEEYKNILQNNVITNNDNPRVCGFALACVAYFAIMIHNTFGITLNIVGVAAIAMYVAVWAEVKVKNPIVSNGNDGLLQYELLVNDVASLDSSL